MEKRKRIKDIAFAAAILLLLMVMLYSGVRIWEYTSQRDAVAQQPASQSKTITRNGIDYFPRQDMTVVMVLGIDQYGEVKDSGSYQNPGASDMDILLVFDESSEVCHVLHLNRDTMLDVPMLGLGGKQAGTWYGQLAMAHTYGSGLEDSCENVKKTISDFLYGLHIDYYIAMNMDAISILNDAVGGVTVTVTDDFSAVDPTIKKGTMTLMGEQAVNFVRTRKDVGDQLNISRIQRHKAYLNGFVEAFREKQQDEEFIIDTYEAVSPYIVTDCSANVINGLINRYGDYTVGEVISPEGRNVLGEEYYEFYVDEEALDELILRLFYAPK